MAVRKAVSAATSIFTAISMIRFFSIISHFFNLMFHIEPAFARHSLCKHSSALA